MKVFGIGLNKTGTKTLGECFTLLGMRNTSYDLELLQAYDSKSFEKILNKACQFDSFEDWPWPLLYKEFDERFPDAKFILTLRKDPDIWYNSLCKHAILTGPTIARKIVYGFEMPADHRQEHLDYYLKHNEEVRAYFQDRPDKLLVVSWEDGDGWIELCNFLGIADIPQVPFPHKNKSAINE